MMYSTGGLLPPGKGAGRERWVQDLRKWSEV